MGKGAQLGAGGPIESGFWQVADGTYSTIGPLSGLALTGRNGGTAADNCNDWQPGTATTAYSGEVPYYESWWGGTSARCPGDPTGFDASVFYCVQEVAP